MLYEKLLDKYFSKHSLDHSYKQNKNVKNKKYNYFVVIPVYVQISSFILNKPY